MGNTIKTGVVNTVHQVEHGTLNVVHQVETGSNQAINTVKTGTVNLAHTVEHENLNVVHKVETGSKQAINAVKTEVQNPRFIHGLQSATKIATGIIALTPIGKLAIKAITAGTAAGGKSGDAAQ